MHIYGFDLDETSETTAEEEAENRDNAALKKRWYQSFDDDLTTDLHTTICEKILSVYDRDLECLDKVT